MILKTPRGDAQFSAFDSSVPIPRPSQAGGAMTYGGRRVTSDDALGLPAFMRGVRLICETTAMMPAVPFQGTGEDRTPEPKTPQAALLRRPLDGVAPFQVWSFAVASMLRGGAYFWKVKNGRTVEQLLPLSPSLIKPKVKGGELLFEMRAQENGPIKKTVTRGEILYVPGVLGDNPHIGISLVEAQRNAIGTQLGRREFEGRYLANDGFPGIVIKHAANKDKKTRDEIRESFEARHQGVANAGRPALLWGGWELDRVAVSLHDAEWIESQRFSVQDVGRMLGVPSGLLNDPVAPGKDSPEQENMRFLTYGLSPWTSRMGQGIAADVDLFPSEDWEVEFDPGFLLRADMLNRFNAYRLARQGGWLAPNEIRLKEGYEPVEGGDEIQVTPVGGAPNADPNAGPSPDPNQEIQPV